MSAFTDRELVKSYYKSKTWSDKVNKMSDAQIIAILLRLKFQGKV